MGQQNRVAFYTLGCKLNFAETSTIGRQFTEAGYAKVSFSESADVYIINTCSVTENADKKCRNIVRKANKLNPDATVIVIGCYAQLKPNEIASIPGVDVVLGANEKFNALEYVHRKEEQAIIAREAIKETKEFIPGFSAGDRTRTFLKVQDGCDYFCSFCTIPLARGRSRSADIATTLKSAKEAIDQGAKEIVLTGVNIGDFGAGTQESFLELIMQLDELPGIERYRISSIEPNLLSDQIIAFVARSKKFMPHFHIPLQSGNDELLAAMRRRYDTSLYTNRIKRIKELMPHACIGVDVIVGFPGETEEHFNVTVNYLKDLDVSYLHVFTYSERANTTALRKDGIVPKNIRYERTRQLNILSDKLKRAFYDTQLGATRTVLWEKDNHDGFMQGYTDNYVRVSAAYQPDKANSCEFIALESIDSNGNVNAIPVVTEKA
ncbi:tRNA (N(6)-L-threonylcarbamoyladenosine(37)-C(2))-methylthiotransferase MtaB [Luteibaculum oceani]|uniref:tRNA (N(6)-L-threonylcarbamoyladenosine(37)-C(2))-methylthiotransferase MtaB n=1 Tax=Luteibaculum oceani TaxID=1294296 RepID=A0A5C6VE67_9FLAO|nr:tRNA (N(6)-L-threonylcarbamoyladenosine(37)-C(2))-methylthiotransferase MtaB [Luteibaculum oceani]TXC82075.1 tRNA (N(6)-L-threonylcarbamoyladenosine(37)-C(2))-methylthiotransferase MtaB [Luteibaculum oceani]